MSVIIPAYNSARFLAGCLDSVLDQGVEHAEIIVVDDGSEDDTPKILKPYLGRIKCIVQENSGLPAARNAGLAIAGGEFIQFLDADDLLGHRSLEGRIDFLRRNPDTDIAVCRNRLFGKVTKKGRPLSYASWRLYSENLDVHLCYLNIAPPNAYLCRKKILETTHGFDVEMRGSEDHDFWLRAVSNGHKLGYCGQGVAYYRRHASNMSNNALNKNRFMAKVRFRLFETLQASPEFPQSGPLAGRLALLAGTLTTARRLLGLDGELRRELIGLSSEITAYLREFAARSPATWKSADLLYLLRNLDELERFPGTESGLKEEVGAALREISRSACGTARPWTLLTKSISSTLHSGGSCALEWLRIAKFGAGLAARRVAMSDG